MSETLKYKLIVTRVNRGSQSIPITFWQVLFRLKDNGRGISADEANNLPAESIIRSVVLSYYKLFNTVNTEGINVKLSSDQLLSGTELIVFCERILKRALIQVKNMKLLSY